MTIDQPSFAERLHKAICAAYDSESLEQMVRFRLNEKLAMVAPKGGRLDVVVFELIQWADLQTRLDQLIRCASEYNPTNAELKALWQEFSTRTPPTPSNGTAAGAEPLPAELVKLIQGYERIPALIEDGPPRLALMEQTVVQVRSLVLIPHGLPDRLHLSESAGERLAAIVALEQAPDPRYLWWLAERVVIERPFVGYVAAIALTNAAHLLDGPMLSRVRANALKSIERLAGNPEATKCRTQLQRAVHVADRRAGSMSSLPDVPFNDVATALSDAFKPADLEALLKAKMDISLETLVGPCKRVETIVYYLLVTADQAGWDGELIKIAAAARPDSAKLKDVAAKYVANL